MKPAFPLLLSLWLCSSTLLAQGGHQTPNGQRFLVNTVIGESDNAPLEVTLNWTSGLKK